MISGAVVSPMYFPALRKNSYRQNKTMRISSKVQGSGGGGGAPSGFGGERKEVTWQCVKGCGACCKLNKGPSYPTPEEIFEDPSDIQLLRSLIGSDGWCIHYDKFLRTCSIYSDRPYFCRVEPDIFQELYGVHTKKFDKEACSFCRDAIKTVYGSKSKELNNFNSAILKGSGK